MRNRTKDSIHLYQECQRDVVPDYQRNIPVNQAIVAFAWWAIVCLAIALDPDDNSATRKAHCCKWYCSCTDKGIPCASHHPLLVLPSSPSYWSGCCCFVGHHSCCRWVRINIKAQCSPPVLVVRLNGERNVKDAADQFHQCSYIPDSQPSRLQDELHCFVYSYLCVAMEPVFLIGVESRKRKRRSSKERQCMILVRPTHITHSSTIGSFTTFLASMP